jgi:hypothetical protein
MRTHVELTVVGSSHRDIVEAAGTAIAKYLGIDDVQDALTKVDLEINVVNNEDEYVGTVHARIK